jgi:Predicted bile acid beta-glucosidase
MSATYRPPAVPLVTHDPYFSVWSFRDRLTDDWARHWTGEVNALCGLVRIDGKTYRWAGNAPQVRDTLEQTGLEITPTQSRYTFEGGGVRLKVTFLSPLLPDDLELVSRPATYLFFEASATDGKQHDVALYTDVTGEWVVNTVGQSVTWGRVRASGGRDILRMGSAEQNVLKYVGDNRRIDWGWLYLAPPAGAATALSSDREARDAFATKGALPGDDDLRMPRPASDAWPVAAAAFDLGRVSTTPVSRTLVLAYDDEFALEYFHRPVRAYWRRAGDEATDLLTKAIRDADSLRKRADAFDASLTKELEAVGGPAYARLCVLAYRQALAAHKLAADFDGTLLFMSKENFSNGCIATVDVTYPSAPLFLALNPELLRGMLTPILDYAGSPRWRFPFAPHDLGTYPKANGQVYGGGERTEENQMPVEECGNMLILMAALAKADGNARYAEKYWPTLTKWAAYLREKGLDPENQLCTDDFAGHMAHNANLSLKAIMALGGYAQLCQTLEKTEDARTYRKAAEDMAQQWVKMAADGDHYKLAFDRPGTWSQKYNLVWDELLGLNLFPATVKRTEVAYYLKKQNQYGLPLDNRADYTKLDWIVWSATLAENRADFDALIAPLAKWLDEGPTRVPMTDWYDTKTGRQSGFQARSVVGGLYLPLLKARWQQKGGAAKP